MMQRSGSFPGLELSPRSAADGGLGLKMVEYLLDSSPTAKDIDLRMSRLGLNDNGVNSNNLNNNLDNTGLVQTQKKKVLGDKESLDSSSTNGNLIQNGLTNGTANSNGLASVDDLDDNKSFNKTPGSTNLDAMINGQNNNGLGVDNQVNKLVQVKNNNISHSAAHSLQTSNNLTDQISNINGSATDFVQNQLNANMFQNYQTDFDNPFGTMDSLQFDYQMMGAIDNSGGILDYSSQQLYGQRNLNNQQTSQQQQTNQPQLQQLQQQYAVTAQQPPQLVNQQNPNAPQNQQPFPQNTYYQQDPYAAQMGHMIPTGPPPMMQQPYYGIISF